MCEYCDQENATASALSEDEQIDCEWIFDDDGENLNVCSEPAEYRVVEEYVEDHLCEQHVREEQRRIEEGLDVFQSSLGLGESEFFPVRDGGICEYFDLLNPTEECRRHATYARRVTVEYVLCAGHARSGGYADEGRHSPQLLTNGHLPVQLEEAPEEEFLGRCGWCSKAIQENHEAFGLGARFRKGCRSSNREARVIKLTLVHVNRVVLAVLPASDSDARKDGNDIVFMTCSEFCGRALKSALEREKQTFSQVRFG